MTLKDIAQALVDACRTHQEMAHLDRAYSADAVSVESADMDGTPRETRGLDGIKGKHVWWEANFDTVSGSVTGPFLHGDDRFAVIFESEVTEKATGNAIAFQEVAIYTVADGKIVREEFYGMA